MLLVLSKYTCLQRPGAGIIIVHSIFSSKCCIIVIPSYAVSPRNTSFSWTTSLVLECP